MLPRLVAAALLAAGCSDAIGPGPRVPGGPKGIELDAVGTQGSGVIGGPATQLGNRFNPNPHVGDAIVATFFWLGSAHVTQVTDHLSGGQQVNNTYFLVDSISSGGVGMATYIATNAQNFPDTSADPTGAKLLVVQADLSAQVTDGGVILSAYSGVQPTYAQAVGAHHARAGSGSSTTTADPDSIAVPAGGLAYGVTAGNAAVAVDRPTTFTLVAHPSDASMVADGEYTVPTSAQTLDPRWTWHFNTQSTWLAEDIALNPSAGGTGPGNLTATTSTSTGTTDPDGYTVAVDSGPGQPIGTSASYTFTNLASGNHTVVLSGVASNCSVAGGTTRTVNVQPGGTAAAAFSVGCSTPSGTGIVLDQWNGTFGQEANAANENTLIKGFNPTNPQLGDAVVATFFWVGSTYIIDSVTDVITTPPPRTPVGNTFHLVEYRTAGGVSMATFVATNIQHFEGGLYDPDGSRIYAVRANLSQSVHGGVLLSAYRGVELSYPQALGLHQSLSGAGTGNTIADPGAINVGVGALAYGVTMTNTPVPMASPTDFMIIGNQQSDNTIKGEGDYRVQASAGPADPRWTWFFDPQVPGTWLASVLALNPPSGSANQPPVASFTQSCTNLSCSFTSTSSDPDGSISAYRWTFGDGSAAVLTQSASHTYAAGGTYTVTLQVTDNQGATNSTSQNVTVSAANQPPVASFTQSCNGLSCSFTSTSSDPDGSIASYRWTFGDGSAAVTTQNASHTYTAGGTYTVTLQVTDNQGATSSTPQNVTVSAANQPPVASFTQSCNGLTCSFTSTSSDPDGSIASYRWTFGDGSAAVTTQNASHTYTAGGTYTVTLQVTDNQGATNSTSQNVTVSSANQPPVAAFTWTCNGLTCTFSDQSTDPGGSIASWYWTTSDGATSTVQNPTYTFPAAGTYTVTLQVTDNQGATNSVSHSVTVSAANQPPVASFTQSCNGLTCSFTSTSSDPDGTIASYRWTFGDGSAAVTTQNASHTYTAGGTYTVTLQVTDNQGATNSTSQNVTVTPPNQPPVASFTKSCNALTCSFTSTSSDPDGSISAYRWTFGDGSAAVTTQNASHTYAAGGTYTVTLQVTDNQGATNSMSKNITVSAPNSAPVVNAGSDETAVTGLLYSTSVSFSDANHNGPWSYTINWGDGTSTGSWTGEGSHTISHTYVVLLLKSFTVTVTVTDAAGASGSDSKVVTVLLL